MLRLEPTTPDLQGDISEPFPTTKPPPGGNKRFKLAPLLHKSINMNTCLVTLKKCFQKIDLFWNQILDRMGS